MYFHRISLHTNGQDFSDIQYSVQQQVYLGEACGEFVGPAVFPADWLKSNVTYKKIRNIHFCKVFTNLKSTKKYAEKSASFS